MADCTYHPGKDAVGACVNCGKMVCTACRHELHDKVYCGPCANKLFVRKDEIQADKATQTPVTQSAQAEAASTTQVAKTMPALPVQPVSGAWWLLPIFFIWLGGLIAWAATKDRYEKSQIYVSMGHRAYLHIRTNLSRYYCFIRGSSRLYD